MSDVSNGAACNAHVLHLRPFLLRALMRSVWLEVMSIKVPLQHHPKLPFHPPLHRHPPPKNVLLCSPLGRYWASEDCSPAEGVLAEEAAEVRSSRGG